MSDEEEVARLLEQDILGPTWYALECGCMLSVYCRMPGPVGLMNLRKFGHRLNCDIHQDKINDFFGAKNNFLGSWKDAPKTWMHWYAPNPRGPGALNQEHFQRCFDDIELELPFKREIALDEERENWSRHPSERWILSVGGTHKIYRTGAVTPIDEASDANG